MKYVFEDEKEKFNLFDSIFFEKFIYRNYLTNNDIDEVLEATKGRELIDTCYLLKTKMYDVEQECMVLSPLLYIIKNCFKFSPSSQQEKRLNSQHELLNLFLKKVDHSLYDPVPISWIDEGGQRIKINKIHSIKKEIAWKISAEIRDSLMIKNVDKELIKNSLITNLNILNNNQVRYNKDLLMKSNIFFFFDQHGESKNCLELVKVISDNESEYQKNLLKMYALSFNAGFDGVMNLRSPLHSQRLDLWKFRKYIESQPFFKIGDIYEYNKQTEKEINFVEYLYQSFDYETADALIDKFEKNEEVERLKVFKPFYLINDIIFHCDYKEKIKKLKLLNKYILNEFNPPMFKSQFNVSLIECIQKEYEKHPYDKKAEKNKNQITALCTQSLIEKEKILIRENINNAFSCDVKRNKRL